MNGHRVRLQKRVWGFAHEWRETCFDCKTDLEVIKEMPTGLLTGRVDPAQPGPRLDGCEQDRRG